MCDNRGLDAAVAHCKSAGSLSSLTVSRGDRRNPYYNMGVLMITAPRDNPSYDLRHSVATILLAAKIDLKVVSELLGHSSVAITADIYAHVLPEQQQEVVDKMGDLFNRS